MVVHTIQHRRQGKQFSEFKASLRQRGKEKILYRTFISALKEQRHTNLLSSRSVYRASSRTVTCVLGHSCVDSERVGKKKKKLVIMQ